jgi:hypothetical protein
MRHVSRKRVSFLFPTQEFRLFSWIPGFLRAKTQVSLTFSYPLNNDKAPTISYASHRILWALSFSHSAFIISRFAFPVLQ